MHGLGENLSGSSMQHPVYYFEEMRALTSRIDALLPGEDDKTPSRPHPNYGLCIRADPVWLKDLEFESGEWRLSREIPASRQSQASRREFARDATTMQTCMTEGMHSKDQDAITPTGMSLWHITCQTTRKLILIRHDLERLFQLGKECMPYTEGLGFFALPGKRQLYYRDCMELMKGKTPYLYGICKEYGEMGCTMYGLTMQEFSRVSRLRISACETGVGSPLLLQESVQSRFDGGPIFIGNVGIPVATYDLTPTLPAPDHGTECCTRVGVHEGGLMVLDGDARFRYACGIPKGQSGGRVIYTLAIHMDSLPETTTLVGYESETRTNIMYTPLSPGGATIPCVFSPYPHCRKERQANTTLGQLILTLRTRVAIAESHLLKQGYAANRVGALGEQG